MATTATGSPSASTIGRNSSTRLCRGSPSPAGWAARRARRSVGAGPAPASAPAMRRRVAAPPGDGGHRRWPARARWCRISMRRIAVVLAPGSPAAVRALRLGRHRGRHRPGRRPGASRSTNSSTSDASRDTTLDSVALRDVVAGHGHERAAGYANEHQSNAHHEREEHRTASPTGRQAVVPHVPRTVAHTFGWVDRTIEPAVPASRSGAAVDPIRARRRPGPPVPGYGRPSRRRGGPTIRTCTTRRPRA